MRLASAVLGVLLAGPLLVSPAHAADSYDGCTFEITSLPTTITTQGIWCLKGDLGTAMTSGDAITVAANNVTVDCNHFKIGGLAAGTGTLTVGINVASRASTTIRHCNVRGFRTGVYLTGATGALVEDNQFESNTVTGILSDNASYGTIIRGNRADDTGGSPTAIIVAGILAYNDAHVIDNFVTGVAGDGAGNTAATGIYIAYGTGSTSGNRVSGLVPDGTGKATGVYSIFGDGHVVEDNYLIGFGSPAMTGVNCDTTVGVARGNAMMLVDAGVAGCEDVDNHVTLN
jgi:parallel beta-helix repeat protein